MQTEIITTDNSIPQGGRSANDPNAQTMPANLVIIDESLAKPTVGNRQRSRLGN